MTLESRERKEGLWNYLNKEAQNASSQGTGFILEMDGNLWAGDSSINQIRIEDFLKSSCIKIQN